MKFTLVTGFLVLIAVAAAAAGQSSRQGGTPRLIIESMTGARMTMLVQH